MKDSSINLKQNSEDLNPASTPIESSPLLPRSGWNNQINYLRLIFRAKRALDRLEQEANL